MGTFDRILSHSESLFKNEIALDFEFVPRKVPQREVEQDTIGYCIKPLTQKRNGRNIVVYGIPGVGKTLAVKHIFRELNEEYEPTSEEGEVKTVFVNCWQKNTSYKIAVDICDQLGFKFVQNKNTTELFNVIARKSNETNVVFAFDEIDKVEDTDFLYHILEEVYRKSIILITNYKDWLANLDERVRSRLTPEQLEFKEYNEAEIKSIIGNRIVDAFYDDVWDDESFFLVAKKTYDVKDVRTGLFLLRQSGLMAEDRASRKVELQDVEKALTKFDGFTIKKSEDLEDETKMIFELVKENSGQKIGDLFKVYQEKGGQASYKTFQRKIEKLSENKFIKTTKQTGAGGNTTIVEKKLTDF